MDIKDVVREGTRSRTVLQIMTILFISFIIVPGVFFLYVVWYARNLHPFAEFIIDYVFPFFKSIPGDLVGMIVGAAPAVLVGVCYTLKDGGKDLNAVGLACVILAIIGFITGLIGNVALRSEDSSLNSIGTPETLFQLRHTSEIVARSSLFYMAVIFGIGGVKK